MTVLFAAFLVASDPAAAAIVKPTSWTASSSASGADGVSYDVANLADAKQSNAWIEGDEGSGLGSWALADLGGEKTISGFTIWAGCWYTQEYWGRYNRPKLLVVEFADGTSQEFTLTDEYKPQEIKFTSPKATSSVKFKVKGVYNGNTFNDTAISEVVFHDGAKSAWTAVSKHAASTTFPPDADGNYEARNTNDGIVDSMWCEGNPKTDGTAEWIEWDFGGAQTVSKLVLRNGNAYSFSYFMKTNRATAATLSFSDGTSEAITIKDTMSEQSIPFASRSTSKVRLTVNTVKKGSEFDDLCLSEANFAP